MVAILRERRRSVRRRRAGAKGGKRRRTSKLCVALLEIADLLHELLNGHVLVVGREMGLRRTRQLGSGGERKREADSPEQHSWHKIRASWRRRCIQQHPR